MGNTHPSTQAVPALQNISITEETEHGGGETKQKQQYDTGNKLVFRDIRTIIIFY
jgi:hypothetical protein